VEGEVPLDLRDDGDTLRQLAQLRRLLQVRSGLDTDAIDRISTTIKELWSSVDAWSRRRRLDRVAMLAYSLTSESLTLTIRDEAGWLSASRGLEPDLVSRILAEAQFDQVIANEEGRCLELVKRFAAP
jgi:hypothetical protein